MMNYAFFYKSVNGDRVYDDTSFEHWLKKFFTSGVFLNDLHVTANNDMTVNVGTGYVNADGKVKIYKEDTTLQIETAGATYPRIDSVVLERNDTERDIILKVIKGGYSSEPVAHVPVRQDGVYQLVIAQILVNAGAVKISQLDIRDTRSDKDLCGIVAGAVDQIDFSQIQAQFDAYMVNYAEYIADYAEQMQADFNAWFENVRNQLDEDAAGNLQNQIDEMKEEMELLGGSKVEVTVDSGEYNVVGLTVNLEINGKIYSETIPQRKVAVFTGVLETGTASITLVDNAQDINTSTSVEIPYYGAYKASIVCKKGGYEGWLASSGYTKEQYPTIADVLADEKAVRKLMTVHASCDKFVDWYNKDNSIFAEFTSNRVAMKWIGLRDYIADKLMAIPSALEQLLASEHWEYILKDKVPKMTSDTEPEGVASTSSYYMSTYKAYCAFERGTKTWFSSKNASLPQNVAYKFVKPIIVRKVELENNGNWIPQTFDIEGSNDGSTWLQLGSFTNPKSTETNGRTEYILDNDKAFFNYRIVVKTVYKSSTSENDQCVAIKELQFYGRFLNESVPIMTSNTAPLGEATANSNASNVFRLFDGDDSSVYLPVDKTLISDFFVQYKFAKAVKPKKAIFKIHCSKESVIQIVASVDGNVWEPISEEITVTNDTSLRSVELNTNKTYLYVRIKCISIVGSTYAHDSGSHALTLSTFQCYGVSYSEEEFGSDGIEMLYDNGVDVATIETYTQGNCKVTKHDDYAVTQSTASSSNQGGLKANVEFASNKKHVVVEYDEKTNASTYVMSGIDGASSYINAETNINTSSETATKGKVVCNTSNVSGTKAVYAACYSGTSLNVDLAKMRKWYLLK